MRDFFAEEIEGKTTTLTLPEKPSKKDFYAEEVETDYYSKEIKPSIKPKVEKPSKIIPEFRALTPELKAKYPLEYKIPEEVVFKKRVERVTDRIFERATGIKPEQAIQAERKLGNLMARAPRVGFAFASPFYALGFETFQQAKNIIVSSIKKEKYSPLETRILSELLPETLPKPVRIGAGITEWLGEIALMGALGNVAKRGLLTKTIKEVGAKLEKAGYKPDKPIVVSREAIKEAVKGTTLEKEAGRYLKAKALKVPPKVKLPPPTEPAITPTAITPIAPKVTPSITPTIPPVVPPVLALKLKSGTIIQDTTAKLHSDIITNKNINPDNIIDVGFIDDKGKYIAVKKPDLVGGAPLETLPKVPKKVLKKAKGIIVKPKDFYAEEIEKPKFEFKIKAGEEWEIARWVHDKITRKKITSEKALDEIKKSLDKQNIKYTVSGKKDYIVIQPPKTEPEFIDQSPPIGLSVKEVVPVSIRIEREPEDLVGAPGMIQSWVSPVRHIAEKHPIANKISHLGRDTITGLSNEQSSYSERIDKAYKGLTEKEEELVTDYLEGKLSLETIPEKLKPAYQEADAIRTEMRTIAQEELGKDISQWGIKPEEYFPHIFVGSYQITDAGKTIEGGFARTLREAVDKAVAYLKQKPEADIKIAPKDFADEYTATLLSRKGFWRFISEVKKATELDKDEILSMMRGVAAIKPRGKFVGNFMQRTVNLGGYLKNRLALKIYINRILRKKWLDPFRKQATDLVTSLEPGLKEYFSDYIDDVSGKYNPMDNKFIISKNVARLTSAQAKLKLGYRPITAFVNRLQPLQTAYAEIGNYLFTGSLFKNTLDGQRIIQDSGILGQLPKYYTGEFLAKPKEPLYKPLGLFSASEIENRKDVIAGGYLFAKKVFQMPKEHIEKMGYGYILNYLDMYKDPYKAALEYAKDLNADTNYIYDVSDMPKLLRQPILRAPLQFKNFPINFTAQIIKWFSEGIKNPTPHNIAKMIRFSYMNLLLGGVRTIPYVGRNLWKWLILIPLLAGLHPKVKQVIGRGIFSLIGVDLSQRLGPNEFLPRNLKDLAGPIGSDLFVLYKYMRGDITLGQAITQPFGALRDIYRALRETEYIADPNQRWRKIVETTGWEKFLQAIGSPILKVEVTRDLKFIINEIEREYKRKKANYVDEIISRRQEGKPYQDIRGKAKGEGITIYPKDYIIEERKKEIPVLERLLKTTPRETRKETREIIKRGFGF